MKDTKPTEFLWINSSTGNAPPDRSKLRREVMQKVALRQKKKPKHHHPNSRQVPTFVFDEDPKDPAHYRHSNIVQWNGFRTSPSPSRGFPATDLPSFAKSNLDFQDLSLLASLEVGRFTGQRLLERPWTIPRFLGGKNWSYCRYVPLYYSQSVLVRGATDCVVARLKCLLTPNATEWESLALSSYSKALSNLQEAVDSTAQNPTAELLCATQILGLYELLNPNRENAWIKHAAGASCIIRVRGPNSYCSEFEKSLLMSHVGPTITESILNNEACFLEHPSWRAVLRSVITNDPLTPERSTMVISLLIILGTIPRLFRDVTTAVCHHPGPPRQTMIELISRARNLRSSLQAWYSIHIGQDDTPINGPVFCDGYCKVLVLFYICSIYCNRLNTSIYETGSQDVIEMEEDSQRFANLVLSLHNEELSSSLQGSLLLAQKVPIAEAVIASADDWMEQLRLDSNRQQLVMIPKDTFKRWCSFFGRRTS